MGKETTEPAPVLIKADAEQYIKSQLVGSSKLKVIEQLTNREIDYNHLQDDIQST
jgi:hypothetical protein